MMGIRFVPEAVRVKLAVVCPMITSVSMAVILDPGAMACRRSARLSTAWTHVWFVDGNRAAADAAAADDDESGIGWKVESLLVVVTVSLSTTTAGDAKPAAGPWKLLTQAQIPKTK